jgi:hypothetical protein
MIPRPLRSLEIIKVTAAVVVARKYYSGPPDLGDCAAWDPDAFGADHVVEIVLCVGEIVGVDAVVA